MSWIVLLGAAAVIVMAAIFVLIYWLSGQGGDE